MLVMWLGSFWPILKVQLSSRLRKQLLDHIFKFSVVQDNRIDFLKTCEQ